MEYISEYVSKALLIALKAHAGQKDKGGNDYINHPVTVATILAKNGCSDLHIATALLHDVAEDSDYTLEDLNQMGFPKEVITALSLLTHSKDIPYMTYIRGVKTNKIAKAVKTADLMHNLDEKRIANPSEKDMARWEKYREALKLLEE